MTAPAPERNDERGVALVITLLIVTLLTVLVMEFTYSVQVESHMTRNSLNALQATFLARSGINILSGALIQDDTPTEDPSVEDLDGWGSFLVDGCSPLPSLQLPPSWDICVRIVDESGKINVNNTKPLRESELEETECLNGNHICWLEALRELILTGADEEIGQEAVDRVSEYWEANLLETVPGQPFRAPRDFDSIEDFASEFPEIWQERNAYRVLVEFATALPVLGARRTTININSAPAEVLTTIIDDAGIVEEVLLRQREQPYRVGELPEGMDNDKRRLLGTNSSLFQLEASAAVNGIGKTVRAFVRRYPAPARTEGAPSWDLVFLDWHKEGGARLLVQAQQESLGLGGDEDLALGRNSANSRF